MKKEFNGGVDIQSMRELELALPGMLLDKDRWTSLNIDYHPPRVERLWTEYMGMRVHLHVIHRTTEPCLLHKHRGPAVIKQVAGEYEMGVTYSETEVGPDAELPMLARFVVGAGTYYEMPNTDALHYVRPLTKTSHSVMITRELFPEAKERKESLDRTLESLSETRVSQILREFTNHIATAAASKIR